MAILLFVMAVIIVLEDEPDFAVPSRTDISSLAGLELTDLLRNRFQFQFKGGDQC